MSKNPIVASVQGLTLRLSRRTVLYDIHLDFPRGSFTAIMGPGGSGKSTLARMLAGWLPVNDEIDFFGRITRPVAGELRIVTQRLRHSGPSIRTMLMNVEASTMAIMQDEEWASYLADEGFGRLAQPLDGPTDLLSPSDQQLLRIAAACWSKPQMIVLDEPFAGLHGGDEDELMRYVEGLKQQHTVVLVEHHQQRARALSDRVALLAAGQLIEVNATEQFFKRPQSIHSEQFIRTGGCSVSSVDAEVALLTSNTENPALRRLTELHLPSVNEAPHQPAPIRQIAEPVPSPALSSPQPSDTLAEPTSLTAPQNAVIDYESKFAAVDAPSRTSPDGAAVMPIDERPTKVATPVSAPSAPPVPEPAASPSSSQARLVGQTRILPSGTHSSAQRSQHADSAAVETAPPIVRYSRPAILPAPQTDTRGRGPQGFCWLIPGELAGCPRPGIVEPISRDFDRIARTGTQVIVTLTQRELDTEPEDLSLFHEICFFPVVDMEAPHRETAIEVCRRMEKHVRAGKAVVYHCRAGLGRTGTMLVMHLIGRGMPSDEALAWARTMNAYWVQSQSQEEFLHSLPVGFLRDES